MLGCSRRHASVCEDRIKVARPGGWNEETRWKAIRANGKEAGEIGGVSRAQFAALEEQGWVALIVENAVVCRETAITELDFIAACIFAANGDIAASIGKARSPCEVSIDPPSVALARDTGLDIRL